MPNPAKPGDLVVVAGSMLDTVQSIAIAGRELEFSIASSNALSVVLPANIAEGLYDLVINSSYGRLTVQDALVVSLTAMTTEPEVEPETESGDGGSSSGGGSGSGNNAGSESSSGTPESSGSGADTGSSGTDTEGAGSNVDGGSTDSGDNGSGTEGPIGGETSEPVPGEQETPGAQAGWLWWIPVIAIALSLLVARRTQSRKVSQ
jgi:hypothetical protein